MVDYIVFALFLTLAIELTIYGFADRFNLKSFFMMLGVNIVLNLSMNFILMSIKNYQTYLLILIIAEVLVFIIESITFYLFSKKKLWFAILIAFTANITSLALGNMFNYLHTIDYAIAFYVLVSLFALIISGEIWFVVCLYLMKKKRSDQ